VGSSGSVGTSAPTSTADETGAPAATEGDLTVLTYNVAGLPEPLSGSMPATYIPMISARLNAFDLVLVQEDFAYHAELIADVDHPYLSEPGAGGALGDGLNRLSRTPFTGHTREGWTACYGEVDSGSDCLTAKGMAWAVHELSPGVFVHVYNFHNDAGGGPEDLDARSQQVDQMLAAIATNSEGAALIVAGDTNMKEASEDILQKLLTGAGLRDACRELSCPEPYRIDRILVRDGDDVALTVSDWRIDASFVTETGDDLSDHEALALDVHWARP
jgi:endonuclease/exonuclease/phosphatase family metal-dependent hydrolase